MSTRPQINVRIDDDFMQAIADIRRMSRGVQVPTASDVIRDAVYDLRARLARKQVGKAGTGGGAG